MSSTLDSYILFSSTSRAIPESVATSQEIRDRSSIFVASVYPATSVKDVRAVVEHVKNVVHRSKPATHEVTAWRCMVLQLGKSGLGGPDDFELKTGSEDDGEHHAGSKVLKVMQDEGVIDAIVIVSRWYGGVMLGPVRFAHFEACAREVCRTFRLKDDMATMVTTLLSLDAILSGLRDDLAALTDGSTSAAAADETTTALLPKKKAPDYVALQESLDIARAKRLIAARENAIKVVKAALKRKKEQAG